MALQPSMNKNKRIVLLSLIVASFATLGMVLAYVMLLRNSRVTCPDGTMRPRIDASAFETRYSGYSAKFQFEIAQKSASGSLEPKQLEAMSEAIQTTRLNLEALAQGYNACAITAKEFEQASRRYGRMAEIAREIDRSTTEPPRSPEERRRLDQYVGEYIRLSKQ